MKNMRLYMALTIALLFCLGGSFALAAPDAAIEALVKKEKPAVVETLSQLVNMESGSRDKEDLDRLSSFLGERLAALGGKVELYVPNEADIRRLHDTPENIGKAVIARFLGSGTRKIMLLAHMDTVYPHGVLSQHPFRIDGNRAYGPGVADDKGGIAIILHTLRLLQARGFRDYAALTVVINADEEISSPGSRKLIARLGAEHDFVFSCEPPSVKTDGLLLATSGIGLARLTVHGKSSHAGMAPELGRNALIELAHQILQTRDLGDPERGIKFNWTMAHAGQRHNVIPALATAVADVRVQKASDLAVIEGAFRERVKWRLISDVKLEADFEARRSPLEATDASRALAKKAQAIYAELGRRLAADDSGNGGGTDAAFAAQSGKPVTAENFGLAGFNFHSAGEEYVDLDSIEPRLYLLVRLVMDTARGR